jgi:galactosylceramidase
LETFDEYASPKQFGWLPRYTADISSVFEIADRPDKTGKCLRQVIARKAQSWAPEWLPYTIIGDRNWTDYEVSADICLDNGGAAGVMGRVNSVGTGYGCVPKGYYLSLAADGTCSLYAPQGRNNNDPGTQLATAKVDNISSNQWHNVKLQFSGEIITGFVDGVQALSATNSLFAKGMAGLAAGTGPGTRNTAYFDNLLINRVGEPAPKPAVLLTGQQAMYKP